MDSNIAIVIFGIWLLIPLIGYIRLSTVATFTALFTYATWKFRRQGKRALYHALIATGFTGILYEIIYNAIGAYVFLKTVEAFVQHFWIWHYVMVAGWLILGLRQVNEYFVLTKGSTTLFIVSLVAWIIWISIGFPSNVPSDIRLNVSGEILNIVTKATLPLAYALGLQPKRKLSIEIVEKVIVSAAK